MVTGRKEEDMEADNGRIENIRQYGYPGIIITIDGKDDEDIISEISKGKNMIGTLQSILLNKYLTRESNKNVFNSMTEATFIYGPEVLVMNGNMIKKVLAA